MRWWPFNKTAGPQPGSREFAQQAANKAAERAVEAAYEAYRLGRRDRPREHHQPHGYSGDAAILGSHDLMNRRVRDMGRNTSQGKRIVSMLTNLVVGTGIQTFSWPFLPQELLEMTEELESIETGELGPRLSFALESDDLFEEWASNSRHCDAEGRLTWAEMQRMLMKESVRVGTGLLVRVFRKDHDLVPLCYQLIEREQLDESQDRDASTGQNKIVGGLELDSSNRVVAYHVYVDHPHEFFGSSQSGLFGAGASLSAGARRQRIPADRVIDLTLYHRPSAVLGATWLDASGQSVWDRDSYMDSEIRSAAVDAAFSFVAHLKNAEKYGGLGFEDGIGDDTDQYGNREFRLGHSPVATVLAPDESLEMVRQTRPNKDAAPFVRLLDSDIAAGSDLSYYSLTGDYASTNFSSARAAKIDEDLAIAPLQNWFSSTVAIRVREDFNAVAAATGRFSTVSPAEFRRNRRAYQRFEAVGNGRDLLDPFKEGEARIKRLNAGLATFKDECARAGKHWIRVLIQRAIEKRISSMLGVPLNFMGAGAAPADQSTDAAADKIADRLHLLQEEA